MYEKKELMAQNDKVTRRKGETSQENDNDFPSDAVNGSIRVK